MRFDRWTLKRGGNPVRSAAFRSPPGMGIAIVRAPVSTGAGPCLVGGVSLLVSFSGGSGIGFIRELEISFVAGMFLSEIAPLTKLPARLSTT